MQAVAAAPAAVAVGAPLQPLLAALAALMLQVPVRRWGRLVRFAEALPALRCCSYKQLKQLPAAAAAVAASLARLRLCGCVHSHRLSVFCRLLAPAAASALLVVVQPCRPAGTPSPGSWTAVLDARLQLASERQQAGAAAMLPPAVLLRLLSRLELQRLQRQLTPPARCCSVCALSCLPRQAKHA